ncbi:PEP-CTERM sorting domain-containing protein [Desulfococcaceae bacterium HSG9]|nr:PEP-CTERM sorting domain-containing protein [Desulfococcaceae bacterium HSG9]
MKKRILISTVLMILGFSVSGASALNIELYDWAFNIDGVTYENYLGDTMPVDGVLNEGLGQLSWSTSEVGSHTFFALLDYQIDADINSFFNEYGYVSGSPENGQTAGVEWQQSWEIDEPGYVFGDIYDNMLIGALDNTNGVPSGSEDDVAMALGYSFTLEEGYQTTIDLFISDSRPESGFYMAHIDPDSNANVYLSGSINQTQEPVPEPGTILLLSCGLICLFGFGRKRIKRN